MTTEKALLQAERCLMWETQLSTPFDFTFLSNPQLCVHFIVTQKHF